MAEPRGEPTSTDIGPGASSMTGTPTVEQAVLRVELRALREMVDQRFGSLERHLSDQDVARELQAKEYERRLLDLNSSHERALQVQGTYVNKDEMSLQMIDIRRRIDTGVDARAQIELDLARLTSNVSQVTADVSALTTSQTWLTRIVIGAVVLALMALVVGTPLLAGRLP